jgi:hypothetical protein
MEIFLKAPGSNHPTTKNAQVNYGAQRRMRHSSHGDDCWKAIMATLRAALQKNGV